MKSALQITEVDVQRAGLLRSGHLHVHLGVEKNLVLHDLVDDDLHLVVVLRIDQGSRPGVDLHKPLLDERRELEAAAKQKELEASKAAKTSETTATK